MNFRLPIMLMQGPFTKAEGQQHRALEIAASILLVVVLPVLLSASIYVLAAWGKRRTTMVKQRGVSVTVGGEPGVAMRNSKFPTLVKVPWEGADTIAALFEDCCHRYAEQRCLGTRELISAEEVAGRDGRSMEVLHLGKYRWMNYATAFESACHFSSGLSNMGHPSDRRAAILADTRAEWLLALQGCCRQSITVVTIYASLGDDALVHSLNETEVLTLICDSKQLKKLPSISFRLNSVKNIIYIEDEGSTVNSDSLNDMKNWNVLSFNDVVKSGRENPVPSALPSSNDIAVIMYTSGSTGLPKGVLIAHENAVATAAAVLSVMPRIGSGDTYLAFLPLAHSFELEAETVMLAAGCAVGYGSPLTLTDASNKIKKGTKGDASMLHPTLLAAVPAILDRVREGVLNKVNEKVVVKKLFNIAYNRRLAAVEGNPLGAWGLEKKLWDAVVFKKIRHILGGKVRLMLCGGAPLSSDTQRFIQICLGTILGQGYGLTETCSAATFTDWDDPRVGHVGPPLPSCYIKLISWEEGGYTISDKPFPRGEIVVGGPAITQGYFNDDKKTSEVFTVDEDGMRWFYSGDIGQFLDDGVLQIIDRKKDIVKLQHGEYVSLGKVEATLAANKYVNNIMVYADPLRKFPVALVVPTRQALENWATNSGKEYGDFYDLCKMEEAAAEVLTSLAKTAKQAKLDKFETPIKVALLPDPWTPESGLVTAAMKLRRNQLKSKFEDELKRLYK